MNLQQVESFFDIVWTDGPFGRVTYGDVFHQNEAEQSAYNFEHADVSWLLQEFDASERMCQALLDAKLALPAYEQVLKASHTFNLLDARRAISVTERQRYILRVRKLARELLRKRICRVVRRSGFRSLRPGARPEWPREPARLPDRNRHRGTAAAGAEGARRCVPRRYPAALR